MKNIFCILSMANIAPLQFQALYQEVGSLELISKLKEEDIDSFLSLTKFRKLQIHKAFHSYDMFMEEMKTNCISFLTVLDQEYPESLKQLSDFPYILFYRGDPSLLKEFSIAIIGSRKPTAYGIFCADLFARKLSEHKIVSVSGMANGIDGISQKSTLGNNGRTVAVLGSSLTDIYPKNNVSLAEDITKNGGLVITEYHHLQRTLPHQFVARNRIISALCSGLLVIEANFKSGTMTTVDFALELGKTIFAVPGNITSSNSNGTNLLIKNGAKLTADIDDILEEYPFIQTMDDEKRKTPLLSEEESFILNLLKEDSPLYIEVICSRAKMKPNRVFSVLNLLQLKGLVSEIGNNVYLFNR